MSVSLLEGEEILSETHPHPLSMFFLPMIWLYIGCVGVSSIVFYEEVCRLIRSLPLGIKGGAVIFLVAWSASLIIPAIVVSLLRINWRWLWTALFLCVSGIIIYGYRHDLAALAASLAQSSAMAGVTSYVGDHWALVVAAQLLTTEKIVGCWLIFAAAIGLLGCTSYRRSHRYYITNRRIVARFGFWIVRERDLLYSKIDDLVVHQNILGSFFNFGTIIPISASGLGTGSDHAFLAAGVEQKLPIGPSIKVTIGGGQSITIPRAPSFYSLYGVPDPERLKNIMLKEMDKREYGYTRRQREQENR